MLLQVHFVALGLYLHLSRLPPAFFLEQLPASDDLRNPAGDALDSTAYDCYSKPTYSSTLQNREEAPSSYTSNNCLNPCGDASCLLLVTIKLYGVCYILHILAAGPWQ